MTPLSRDPEKLRAWRRRSKPLERGKPPKRKTRLSPIGRRGRRQREEGELFGEQAARCREMPCAACGAPPPSVPHHEPPRSLGGKDADTLPLCPWDHKRRHDLGSVEAFEKETGVDLLDEVERMREET